VNVSPGPALALDGPVASVTYRKLSCLYLQLAFDRIALVDATFRIAFHIIALCAGALTLIES